jgi:hypothetical protein
LCGFGTYTVILRKKHRLAVLWNWVPKKTFKPKGDEVIGEWRRLHNEELYDLYCSTNIIRVINSRNRWARHVAHMGDRWCIQGFGGEK